MPTTDGDESKVFAAVALDEGMGHLVLGAHPWTAQPTDLKEFKALFVKDFEREIHDAETFLFWQPRIKRLFHHVGAASAFIGEALQQEVGDPPGILTPAQLKLAFRLVRKLICPVSSRRQICRDVDFMTGRLDLAAEWAALGGVPPER